jgi:hypothetical protein
MVNKALFDSYKAALGTVAALAERDLAALMEQCAGLSLDGVRDLLKRDYPALAAKYGEVAAAAALDFYQQARALAGIKTEYKPTMPDAVDAKACEGDVGYHMGAQYQAGAIDAALLQSALSGSLDRRVLCQADAALIGNAQRDPAKPKWAIVPHSGACGWCVTLGSNGFHYSSSASVESQRHDHCKCTTVVDFSKHGSVDGYDPDALYDAFAAARKKAKPEAQAQWESMTQEQRERWRDKHRQLWDDRKMSKRHKEYPMWAVKADFIEKDTMNRIVRALAP